MDNIKDFPGSDPVEIEAEHAPASNEGALREGEINEVQRPLLYFDAQVQFAQKWSELSGVSFTEALIDKTVIGRRLSPKLRSYEEAPESWKIRLDEISRLGPEDITSSLYTMYLLRDGSKYEVHKSPVRMFGYDYYSDRGVVKVHFEGVARGESPFTPENIEKGKADLAAVIKDAKEKHPEAATVVSATWLRSTERYQSIFPPNLNEPESLMSIDMHFGGDSLWGQFVDRFGNINERVYYSFFESVVEASTLEELIEAFPYQVLRVQDPIEKYL